MSEYTTTITEFEVKLKRAMDIAIRGHVGQLDKLGRPYIQHLMGVASRVSDKAIPVALLHDYFEDVYKTTDPKEMAKTLPFFTEEEIEALVLLTRPKDKTYRMYIERIAFSGSRIAIQVKIADLEDHLETVEELGPELHDRYRKAHRMLKYKIGYDIGKEDPFALLKDPM